MEQTDKEILEELGRKIRQARKASKMKQAELAEKVGMDRGYIGMVEKGSFNISFLKSYNQNRSAIFNRNDMIGEELGVEIKI